MAAFDVVTKRVGDASDDRGAVGVSAQAESARATIVMPNPSAGTGRTLDFMLASLS